MAKKRTKVSTAKSKSKPRQEMTHVWGILVLGCSLAFLLSLLSFAYGSPTTNWIGRVGHVIGWGGHFLFGPSSYFICLYFLWVGWRWLLLKPISAPWTKTVAAGFYVLSSGVLFSLIEDRFPSWSYVLHKIFYPHMTPQREYYELGGVFCTFLYRDIPGLSLQQLLNTSGVFIVFGTTLLASILALFKLSPAPIARWVIGWCTHAFAPGNPTEDTEEPIDDETSTDLKRFVKVRVPDSSLPPLMPQKEILQPLAPDLIAIQPESNPIERPSLSRKQQMDQGSVKDPPSLRFNLGKPKREAAIAAQRVYNGDFTSYRLPSLSLLSNPKKVDQSSLKQNLRRQAEVLEETLHSFGIEAKVGQINCGPTITSFEVHPAIGVKVQKIKALENDIALNMEAKSIRIIAPIPGKAAVGIEVPNANPQEVSFRDLLSSYQQGNRKFHIPLLLGKAVNGDYVMSDLTKMPHCIIAGATGSGKSVCINTIVMSIVYNAKPDEIKLVMVDPKKVELTPYAKLPHMLAPVITEPQGACAALHWLVKEMESRYDLLKLLGVRNIDSYNNRKIDAEHEATLQREIPERLPYIVGIIDELADLMMVASNDIETPIARIAQMARAVGIHLILATQRPSREVITGLIKANFPTRIAFKVASRVNSQIVLDEIGAEALLGNGDMLFLPPGTSQLVRAQGAFIRDEDINAVVQFVCDQAPPRYVIPSFDELGRQAAEQAEAQEDDPQDSLFRQARDIVVQSGNASTTFLQRKLKIGYSRAASLIDQLESEGVIAPGEGSNKARKVLAGRPAEDSMELTTETTEDQVN